MRNSHFLNRFPFLSWHIFSHKPMIFLVKSLEIWSDFFSISSSLFSMFFSYLHEISLVFPIFPAFFAIFPRFPQVFPRFPQPPRLRRASLCFEAPAGPGGGVQAPHRGNGLGLASGAERGEGGDLTRGEAAR